MAAALEILTERNSAKKSGQAGAKKTIRQRQNIVLATSLVFGRFFAEFPAKFLSRDSFWFFFF
jgi:hypothetical protein